MRIGSMYKMVCNHLIAFTFCLAYHCAHTLKRANWKAKKKKKNAADISNEIENIVEWNQMLRIMICKFCQKSINGEASLAFSSESDGFHRPAIEHITYLNREMYSYVISFLSQKQHNAIIWLDWFFSVSHLIKHIFRMYRLRSPARRYVSRDYIFHMFVILIEQIFTGPYWKWRT